MVVLDYFFSYCLKLPSFLPSDWVHGCRALVVIAMIVQGVTILVSVYMAYMAAGMNIGHMIAGCANFVSGEIFYVLNFERPSYCQQYLIPRSSSSTTLCVSVRWRAGKTDEEDCEVKKCHAIIWTKWPLIRSILLMNWLLSCLRPFKKTVKQQIC